MWQPPDAAREGARRSNGEFGTQDHADPGIVPVVLDPNRTWDPYQSDLPTTVQDPPAWQSPPGVPSAEALASSRESRQRRLDHMAETDIYPVRTAEPSTRQLLDWLVESTQMSDPAIESAMIGPDLSRVPTTKRPSLWSRLTGRERRATTQPSTSAADATIWSLVDNTSKRDFDAASASGTPDLDDVWHEVAKTGWTPGPDFRVVPRDEL